MPVILTLRRQRQEDHSLEVSLDYIAIFFLRTKASLAWWRSIHTILAIGRLRQGGYKFIASLGYNRKPSEKMKQSPKAGELFSSSPIQVSSGEAHTPGQGTGVLCADPLGCFYSCEMGHILNLGTNLKA